MWMNIEKLFQKEEPPKQRRMDCILQRQDSWSSFYTGETQAIVLTHLCDLLPCRVTRYLYDW